uniref:Large ribosomal subunit protein bL33c n=1 Tax=Carex agglomerata TaxID=2802308 RepID=A0A8B0SDJ6_9POAL|nr:ribosomal protein L33 [Carex agglomerata]QTX08869.1 ribosomal protein L33 [Carex agglomerata]
MAKGKDLRVRIFLECTNCVRRSINKRSMGISRYITQKNRSNTLNLLELRKFCRYCNKHMTHREINIKK